MHLVERMTHVGNCKWFNMTKQFMTWTCETYEKKKEETIFVLKILEVFRMLRTGSSRYG